MNNQNLHYIALTIGPIYETMSYCKKTRELWAGSYFFSLFMKKLILKLSQENIQFEVPYVPENISDAKFEIGVFHDRFIAKSELKKEELQSRLEKRISETLHEMCKEILKDENAYEALKEYLQYHYIIATKEELLNSTLKENVIFAIDAVLDSLELQNSFSYNNSSNIYKQKSEKSKSSFENESFKELINPVAKLQYEADRLKKDQNINYKFKSIPEIALVQIFENEKFKEFDFTNYKGEDNLDDYDLLYSELEKYDKKNKLKTLKHHHRYYAVVSADGDKMGKKIRTNPDDITTISQNIYNYITQEEQKEQIQPLQNIFEDFGGMLIYAGGDDMLGFLPIFGKNNEAFLSVLKELSQKFNNVVGNDVSLSFGVSINYYKSPMINAIHSAHHMLFDVAKKHNTNSRSGSISISLTKHSGQSLETTFFLTDDSYTKYKELFEDEVSGRLSLPHSIQYSMKGYENLFIDIFTNGTNVNTRLDSTFKRLVQDDSQKNELSSSLEEIKNYLKVIQPKCDKEYQKFIAQLAIIKFLRGDR